MRKFLFLLIATLLLTSYTWAETNEDKPDYKTETRSVRAFKKIVLDGPVYVVYTQGSRCAVSVKAPADRLADVSVASDGQTLVISQKSSASGFWNLFGNGANAPSVIVTVTSPDLIEVCLIGSGDFVSNARLDTDKLRLLLRGSGDMVLKDIICDDITTELVGSGDISLPNVDALKSKIELIGSGDINIRQKNVRNTSIELKGSGDISVAFTNCGSATCSLKGSGDITLTGSLKSLKKSSIGSGDYHTSKLKEGF